MKSEPGGVASALMMELSFEEELGPGFNYAGHPGVPSPPGVRGKRAEPLPRVKVPAIDKARPTPLWIRRLDQPFQRFPNPSVIDVPEADCGSSEVTGHAVVGGSTGVSAQSPSPRGEPLHPSLRGLLDRGDRAGHREVRKDQHLPVGREVLRSVQTLPVNPPSVRLAFRQDVRGPTMLRDVSLGVQHVRVPGRPVQELGEGPVSNGGLILFEEPIEHLLLRHGGGKELGNMTRWRARAGSGPIRRRRRPARGPSYRADSGREKRPKTRLVGWGGT